MAGNIRIGRLTQLPHFGHQSPEFPVVLAVMGVVFELARAWISRKNGYGDNSSRRVLT